VTGRDAASLVGQSASIAASAQGTASGAVQPHSNSTAARPVLLTSPVIPSQPVNTTVQFQVATVTSAFVLPGLGRGDMSVKP